MPANAAQGLVSAPIGLENGEALEGDVANVAHFFRRGVRYITLTHGADNALADSSGGRTRTHGGLSAFGRTVVAEMNRVGVMVDVAHLSDESVRDYQYVVHFFLH